MRPSWPSCRVEVCDEREHRWASQACQAQPALAADDRTVELSEPVS